MVHAPAASGDGPLRSRSGGGSFGSVTAESEKARPTSGGEAEAEAEGSALADETRAVTCRNE